MNAIFDHEKLEVYQRSIQFVSDATVLLERIPKSTSLWSQLDRASTSIPLNVAEGNGKWSKKDRCRFLDIAHGSALECAAALDICVAKELLPEGDVAELKETLKVIVRMLVGLIKANDPEREFGKSQTVKEEEIPYSLSVGE